MAALASADGPAAYPPGIKVCGTFSGPHWSYKGRGSANYVVYVQHGGSCTLGRKWAPRLVGKRSRDAAYAITGGPPGFACSNSPLHFGVCVQSSNGHAVPSGKSFAWAGKP
jgi:hypothetical protein